MYRSPNCSTALALASSGPHSVSTDAGGDIEVSIRMTGISTSAETAVRRTRPLVHGIASRPISLQLSDAISVDRVHVKRNAEPWACWHCVEAVFHRERLDHQVVLQHVRDADGVGDAR